MALLDLDATAVCAETSECPGAVALVADVTDAAALEAAVIEAVARLDQGAPSAAARTARRWQDDYRERGRAGGRGRTHADHQH